MNTIWVLLLAADVMSGQADMKAQHEKQINAGKISITWNVAHTHALVKVSNGADADWQKNKAWLANAVKIYDAVTIEEFKRTVFYTDEWQPKEQP